MKASTLIETKVRFACPECGSIEHSCAHLAAGKAFGPWYCDTCGCAITGVAGEAGAAEIERVPGRRQVHTLVLLRLREPLMDGTEVHIVVEGLGFSEADQPFLYGEHDEYFYNEGTCPWNYLRLPIKAGDDADPHGIFVHQETIPRPAGYDGGSLDGIEQWRAWFPSLQG